MSLRGKFAENLTKNLKKLQGEETQQAFARRLGLSQPTLFRILMREQNINIDTLEKICRRLHVSATALLEQ